MTGLPSSISDEKAWPNRGCAPAARPDWASDIDRLPALGIITPSYNQGRYIEATIRSVLLQGYPKLEYYIEDGGSTDESVEVIKRYEEFLSGWVSEKDRGQSHAINKGMARFEDATHVNWLNSDDYLMPGALWKLAERIMAASDASIFIGASRRVFPETKSEKIHRPENVTLEDVLHWRERFISQPAAYFRRDLFEAIGGLREDVHYCMDFEMWIRMFERPEVRAEVFPDVLVSTVHQEDAKTVASRGRMHGESAAVLMEHGYREEAIQLVESVYQDYFEASRIFRVIESLPGGRQALQAYNRLKRRD
ncbi:glycosyltransferase [bacterium]|nr:glycosyltransferase [bacterium]